MLKSIVQIEVNRDAPVEKCLRFLLLLRYSLLCYLLTAYITKAPPFYLLLESASDILKSVMTKNFLSFAQAESSAFGFLQHPSPCRKS